MTLYSVKVKKNNKSYTDFVLVWRYGDKVCDMRVEPCFNKTNCFKVLYGASEKVNSYEELAKLTEKAVLR